MIKRKRIGLAALLALLMLPMTAQEAADTSYVFRYVPKRDMFYSPWNGNEVVLDSLLNVLEANKDCLHAGKMYVCVSSYGASPGKNTTTRRMGYLRNNRVKSELITRGGLTEQMFVTDRLIPAAYKDSLRDVVVVTFPAAIEQIERIAGPEAAGKVRAYYQKIEEEKKAEANKLRTLAEATEREEMRRSAEREALEREAAELQPLQKEKVISDTKENKNNCLAFRANLLRWVTLTPDIGIEWRMHPNWSINVNGSWTSWSWDNKNRRYALWEIRPEIRYYIGQQKHGYIGAMYHVGEFNYKLGRTGKQGDLQGAGVIGGYLLKLNRSLSLDFGIGIGGAHANYNKYEVINGVRVKQGKKSRNYWGIDHTGITLVWTIL